MSTSGPSSAESSFPWDSRRPTYEDPSHTTACSAACFVLIIERNGDGRALRSSKLGLRSVLCTVQDARRLLRGKGGGRRRSSGSRRGSGRRVGLRGRSGVLVVKVLRGSVQPRLLSLQRGSYRKREKTRER